LNQGRASGIGLIGLGDSAPMKIFQEIQPAYKRVLPLSPSKSVRSKMEVFFHIDKDAVIGIDSRKAGRKKRKKKELFGDINDPLKRELASGQTQLVSYTES